MAKGKQKVALIKDHQQPNIIEHSPQPATEEKKQPWYLPYLIVVATTFLVYFSAINNEYALDDLLAISGNSFVMSGTDGLKDIFTKDAFVGFFGERGATLISGGRYRPLSFASFAIEYELYGLKPHYSHFINVLLFAILCCCIFYFLKQLSKEQFPFDTPERNILWTFPFIVTFLYLVHPIHTEVVANIKGRDELFGMLFAVISLITLIKYVHTQRFYYLLFTGGSFFLGLMSKENTITFAGIIPMTFFIFFSKKLKQKSFIYGYGLVLISVACYLMLRASFTATGVTDESPEILNNPFIRANLEEKWATIAYSFVMYFKLLLIPHPLTHDYYFNQIPYKHFSDIIVLFSVILHGGLLMLFIKELKKKSIIAYGIGFYFITFSIVSNIPFTVGIIMNERFVFISSLGFILAIVFAVKRYVWSNKKMEQPMALLAIAISIGFSYKTFSRNFAWKDNHTLFETDIQASPNSAKINTALAADYLELADSAKSESEKNELCQQSLNLINHALEIYPENSGAYLLKGNAIFKRNQNYDSAILCFRQALYYRPNDYFDGYYNMAATFMNQKRYDSSLAYAKQAFRVNEKHSSSCRILAFSYLATGNLTAAEETYKKVEQLDKVKLFDSEISKLIYFADNLKETGNADMAFNLYEAVLKQDPNSPEGNYGKGIILGKFKNQLGASIPYLEKAVSLDTTKTAWKEDLAVAYGFSGQYAKTIPLLEKVIAAEPEYANAYTNIAASYSFLGNKAKANYYSELAKTKKIKE